MKFLILFFKVFFLNIILLSLFNTLFAFSGRVLFLKGNVFLYDKKANTEISFKIENREIIFNHQIIKIGKNSKAILFLNDEIEIRCNENSKIGFEKGYIKVLSGKIWIRKIKSTKDFDFKFNNEIYSIKYGSFNIDADKRKFDIYDGVVFKNEKEIKQELNYYKNDEWLDWNFDREKFNIAVVVNNEKFDKEIEKTIKNFFTGKYIFSIVGIYRNFSEILNCDIILDCDIRADTDCVKINAVLKDGATFETFNLINSDCDEKGLSEDIIKQMLQTKIIKILIAFSNNIEREYIRKIIKEGRNIVIETEISSDDDVLLMEKFIEKIPGVKVLKMYKFYGQKAVFFIKYNGTGSDLREYLDNRKAGKNKINVWKYSKNIVKLVITKDN